MMGLILGFASLVIQKIWRDFAALGWPSAKVWIYWGMVRSWHLGRQGNAGVGVDCMGVGFGISKTLSHLGRKKVI